MEKRTRKEKAAATKENIFSTAVGLIKEKGYANVTVSEICERAEVAKGTFYVHYASKEDIIRESYYSDMGAFIEARYDGFLKCVPDGAFAKAGVQPDPLPGNRLPYGGGTDRSLCRRRIYLPGECRSGHYGHLVLFQSRL